MKSNKKTPSVCLKESRHISISLEESHEPLISVIVPAHNAECHILKCLHSISNQDIPFNYEIVAIDDFSKDKTNELIKKYSRLDPRIRIITNNKRLGAYASRNIGVSHSIGKILAFIDADCTAAKNWLNKLIKPLIEGRSFASIGPNFLSEDKGIWITTENMRCRLYYEKGGVDTKNFAIFRDIFMEVNGFKNSLSSGGDLDLWHTLKNSNIKIVKTNAIVYHHLENNLIKLLLKNRKYAEGDVHYHKKTKGKIPVLALVDYSLTMPIIYLRFLKKSRISLSFSKLLLSIIYLTLSRMLRNFIVIASCKSQLKNRMD